MSQPHALIVGGSMGGLAAACALRQIGWRVTVLEQSSEPLEVHLVHEQGLAELFRQAVVKA